MEPGEYEKPKLGNINGYKYFFDPSHPLSFGSGSVYDHRHEASVKIGRWLRKDEVVHHIDGDRANNAHDNLEIMTHKTHSHHHSKERGNIPWEKEHCPVCNKVFIRKRDRQYFCSNACRGTSQRRVEWPAKKVLQKDLESMNREAVGRKYGVAGNTIRKWARKYGLL